MFINVSGLLGYMVSVATSMHAAQVEQMCLFVRRSVSYSLHHRILRECSFCCRVKMKMLCVEMM